MNIRWIDRKMHVPARLPLKLLSLSLALASLLLLGVAGLRTTYAAPRACVPGPHTGTITADEEWCLADNPHIVNGTVVVATGATVTVEPGVEIQLSPGSGGFTLNGGLVAQGTADLPITFTPQAGNWAGIFAYNGSQLQLGYCDVGFAAGDYWHTSITVQSGTDVHISHCRIHDMAGVGLKLQNDGLTGVFEDLEIDHNSGEAVQQNTLNMNPTYVNLSIHDNDLDVVSIPLTTLNQDVTLDGSPAALNGASIYLDGGTISASYTLTVTPGTLLMFREGSGGFAVNGGLVASGTADQPINFSAQAGNWAGITAYSGSQLQLGYCDVGFAAGDYWHTSITVQSGTDVQISHCRIHDMAGSGLNLQNNGLTGTFEDLEIDHNSGDAILQSTLNMNPTYINLNIHDNGLDAVDIPYTDLNQDVLLDGSSGALNGAPIYLEGGTIPAGFTLTVTPGSLMKFREGSGGFALGGGLMAEGTPTEPITFTMRASNWAGIIAYSGSTLKLGYCDVGYASGDYWHTSITVQSGTDVQISHCRIHDMAGAGLNLQNNGLTGVFEDLEIDQNSGEAVLQNTLNMNPTYINLNIHDNGLDGVSIPFTNQNQDVTLDGSPAALNGASIYLEGAVVVAGYKLTINPGTMLKMKEGSGGVYVYGSLLAEGTAQQPITFAAQSGHWAGLVAYAGSQFSLAFCDVDYAGGDYSLRAMEVGTSLATIRNCLIHHSMGNGLNVTAPQIKLQNIALIDNASIALWVGSGAQIEGQHLTVARNGTGIQIAPDSRAILTNTIIAGNTIGVDVQSGGSATLIQTLWDSNTTAMVGVVDEVGHIDGSADFDAGGYHILSSSEAIQRGTATGLSDDIDGDPRPMPVGTAPDLGVDENHVLRYFTFRLPLVLR